MPTILGATGVATGIAGLTSLAEKVVGKQPITDFINFYSGAKNTKMKAARKEVEKNKSPLNNNAEEYYEKMDKKCPPGHMYLGKSRGCVKIGGRKNRQKK